MPTERYSLQIDVDTRKARSSVNSLAGSLARLAGPVGFGLLAKQVITVGMRFQTLRVQLETVTGSAERAAAAFEGIKDFASSTPFQVENVTKAFTNLAAKGFAPTTENLRALGDMAAAFGTDITQAVQAVTQAAFGEAEMLKQYGIIMRQQGDSVKITYKGMTQEVVKDSAAIFGALTELANVNVAGGMERQSQTLAGRLSTLKDNWNNLMDTVAQSGAIDLATKTVELLTEGVSNMTTAFKRAKPAAAELMAEIVGAFARGFSVVNRAIGGFVKNTVLQLQNAPWIVRAMLDPTGSLRKGGAAIAMAFSQAADEVEELGDRWQSIFRIMAADARETLTETEQGFQSLAKAISGSGGPSEALQEMRRETELLRNALEAALAAVTPLESVALPEILSDSLEITVDPFAEKLIQQATREWEQIVRDYSEVVDTFAHVGMVFVDQLFHGFDRIEDALQRMGGILGSKFLGDIFADLGETLGGKAGDVLGAMAPGIGGIIGSFAGKLLGKLFGGGNKTVASALIGAGSGAQVDTTGGVGELPRQELLLDLEQTLGGMPLGDLADAFREFNERVQEIAALTGASFTFTDQIRINLQKEGQVWVNILRAGQEISKEFSNINDAFDYALSELLRTAEISGQITPAIEEILRSGMAFGEMIEALNLVVGLSDNLLRMSDSVDRAAASIADALQPFDALRQDILALGLSAEATAPLLAEVAKAEARRNKELKTGLLAEMAAWARELGANLGLQRKVAILEAKVRAKELEVQLKMLGMWERWKGTVLELRNLSLEAARAIGTAVNTVTGLGGGGGGGFENLAKSIGREVGKSVKESYKAVVGTGVGPEDRVVDALNQIGIQDAYKGPFDQLNALARDFMHEWDRHLQMNRIDQARYQQGIEQFKAAFNSAFRRLIDGLQREIGDLRKSLEEQYGRGNPLEKSADSFSEFQRLFALAMAGDVDALSAIKEAAQRALDDASSAFGTSTTAFTDIFNTVMGGLKRLQEANIEPPDPTEAINQQTTAVVNSLSDVQRVIARTAMEQKQVLVDIRTALNTREVYT